MSEYTGRASVVFLCYIWARKSAGSSKMPSFGLQAGRPGGNSSLVTPASPTSLQTLSSLTSDQSPQNTITQRGAATRPLGCQRYEGKATDAPKPRRDKRVAPAVPLCFARPAPRKCVRHFWVSEHTPLCRTRDFLFVRNRRQFLIGSQLSMSLSSPRRPHILCWRDAGCVSCLTVKESHSFVRLCTCPLRRVCGRPRH